MVSMFIESSFETSGRVSNFIETVFAAFKPVSMFIDGTNERTAHPVSGNAVTVSVVKCIDFNEGGVKC